MTAENLLDMIRTQVEILPYHILDDAMAALQTCYEQLVDLEMEL